MFLSLMEPVQWKPCEAVDESTNILYFVLNDRLLVTEMTACALNTSVIISHIIYPTWEECFSCLGRWVNTVA